MNEHNDISNDDEFARKAKTLFDESVEGLDGETRSRLNRGRQAALAELHTRPRRWMNRWTNRWTQWAPAGGVAVAAVAALVVWSGGSQLEPENTPDVVADMEMLLTEDSFEMLEDLEFYSWIDLDDEALEI